MSEIAIQRNVSELEADRVTDKEGHWFLRHVTLGEHRHDDDLHVFLVSAAAPAGTLGRDLRPERLEFSGLPGGDLALSLDLLAQLTAWP